MCRVVDPELHISLSWFENVYNSKCIISCKVILTLFLSLPDLAHNLIKFRFLLHWMNENSIFSYVYHQNIVIFGFSFILWTHFANFFLLKVPWTLNLKISLTISELQVNQFTVFLSEAEFLSEYDCTFWNHNCIGFKSWSHPDPDSNKLFGSDWIRIRNSFTMRSMNDFVVITMFCCKVEYLFYLRVMGAFWK